MPRTARPPRDRLPAGIAALAVGALIAAGIALVDGAPGQAAPAPVPAVMDTDRDGIADGSPLDTTDATVAAADPAAGTAPPPAAGIPNGPAPDGPASGSAAPDGPAPDGAATPIDAVRRFVAGLGTGDLASAYRLMHPRYRDAFGSFARFGEDAPVGRFGRFGALGGAGYQSAVFERTVDGEPVAVVSVYGTVAGHGVSATDSMSMIARKAESGWLVEAGGEGGSVFQHPGEPGGQVTAGHPLVVWTPSAGLKEVLAVVDGEPRDTSVIELADPGETAEVRVAGYSPGGQQAAIGVLREDGSVDTVSTWLVA